MPARITPVGTSARSSGDLREIVERLRALPPELRDMAIVEMRRAVIRVEDRATEMAPVDDFGSPLTGRRLAPTLGA